jgi:hypothetical protein
MKSKKVAVFLIFLLLLFALSTLAETKKLTKIGEYTFARIKGKIPTQEVMKMLVDRYAGDIKYGFDQAGYGNLYLPFLDQLKSATFEEKSLPVGDKLMWMLFRSQGKVKVVQDIEWAGKAPLEIFAFNVKKDYKNYEFVMPRPCGNISLRSITSLEKPPAICAISATPAKVNLKDPVTVDVSGCQSAKSMEVDVLGPDGAKITTHGFTPDSPKWQTSFDKPGNYTFKAKAINEDGKPSTNPCEAKVYVNAPPTCQLKTSCLPCKNFVGKPVTMDASGSTDPDGKVVKADFAIADQAGNPVDKAIDDTPPLIWEYIFKKPGSYAVTVVVTDDFGAISEPCRVILDVTQKRGYFSIEGGPLFAKGSHGPYVFVKLDYHYWITPDKVDFSIAAGPAIALKDKPWKSFFLADALINYHAGAFFIGGGPGFSTASREGKDAVFEIVGDVGVDIFKAEKNRGALVFEFRWGVAEKISENHKFIFGFKVFL